MNYTRHQQRGVGLFDGIAALAVLAFGLLALTRFQGKLVAQATEAQHRMVASQLADELVNTMLVDTTNLACYTLPASGACTAGGANATTFTNAWKARAISLLPNAATPTVVVAASGRITVTMQWTWTSKDGGASAAELRTHTLISG